MSDERVRPDLDIPDVPARPQSREDRARTLAQINAIRERFPRRKTPKGTKPKRLYRVNEQSGDWEVAP